MKNRTSYGLMALALGTSLVLAGCSSDGNDPAENPLLSPSASDSPTDAPTGAPTPTAEDIAALDAVKLTSAAGVEPTVEFKQPLTVSTVLARSIEDGTGEPLEDGQKLSIQSANFDGADGTLLGSTWKTNPQIVTMGASGLPPMDEVLAGKKVGARFLMAGPATGQDGSTITLVAAYEVTAAKTVPNRAEGDAVAPVDGLPTVKLDDTGKPSIDIPKDYKAPTELVVQPLIKGDGPKLENGQAVTVNYTGWTLDGQPFDSSWENGKTLDIPSLGAGGVIPGWDQGLVGQTVGSQVLLVIPPELAYGPTADPSSPLAGKPLLFVVDILAAG